MNPYIFTYNAIGVTWFVFFTVVFTIVGYGIIKFLGKKTDIDKGILEDTFFLLLITGLVGSRLAYVLLNLDIYMQDLSYVIRLSHLNLSLTGGIIFSLVALWIVSKRKNVDFGEILNIFSIPLYLSLAGGIWTMYFDGMLIGKKYGGLLAMNYLGADRHMVALYMSILFVVAMVWEGLKFRNIRENFRYGSVVTLFVVVGLYYLVKSVFAY